jgi:hypothetical protein
MSMLKKTRPSPAMVVAVVALIAALAGTAYAAQTINGGAIKKQTIGGGKLKKKTLTGFQINTRKLGVVPAAERATHTYWAVVNNPAGPGNATLSRVSTEGIGVAEGGGAVVVTFPADVTVCADVAGANSVATPIAATAIAQTNNAVGNASGIEVHTRDEKGAKTDSDFHLIVVCP